MNGNKYLNVNSYYLTCLPSNIGTITTNCQRLINEASSRITFSNTPNNGYLLKEHISDATFPNNIANDSIVSAKLKKETVFSHNMK